MRLNAPTNQTNMPRWPFTDTQSDHRIRFRTLFPACLKEVAGSDSSELLPAVFSFSSHSEVITMIDPVCSVICSSSVTTIVGGGGGGRRVVWPGAHPRLSRFPLSLLLADRFWSYFCMLMRIQKPRRSVPRTAPPNNDNLGIMAKEKDGE